MTDDTRYAQHQGGELANGRVRIEHSASAQVVAKESEARADGRWQRAEGRERAKRPGVARSRARARAWTDEDMVQDRTRQ